MDSYEMLGEVAANMDPRHLPEDGVCPLSGTSNPLKGWGEMAGCPFIDMWYIVHGGGRHISTFCANRGHEHSFEE